jgi:hypothetical protein
VAIAATWLTTATFTTSAALYTTPTTGYQRDLVITHSGTVGCYFSAGTVVTSAATTSSCYLPPGGSAILTQGQVPTSTIIYGVQYAATNTSQLSIGWGSLVSYV